MNGQRTHRAHRAGWAGLMRYRYLDIMRGLAALSVLFLHYQHFFYVEAEADFMATNGLRPTQPFFDWLMPFYMYGSSAVEFFWALSGFVLAAAYIDRKTSTSEYVINRVARLYPLHLITLVLVAALQFLSWRMLGHQQIYLFNDAFHFVLNIFSIQWMGEWAFNAPTWSVSVEVAVYVLFFLTLPLLKSRRLATPVVFAALAFLIQQCGATSWLVKCIMYFYLGAAAWVVLQWSARLALALGLVVLAGFLAYRWGVPGGLSFPEMAIVFPALILVGASFDVLMPLRTKAFDWLGNSTYSTYLLHVPIQIAALTAIQYFGGDQIAIAQSKFTLVVFVIGVVGAGVLCYRFVEMPCKSFTKRLLTGSKSPAVIPVQVSG